MNENMHHPEQMDGLKRIDTEIRSNMQIGDSNVDKREKRFHSSLKFITLVRCAYAVLVLIYSTLWYFVINHGEDASAFLLRCGVIEIFIFTGICCFALIRKRFIRPVVYIGMMHDSLLAAFIVLITGYYSSPFLYLLLIIPLYGGILDQKKGGLIGASMVSIVMVLLMFVRTPFISDRMGVVTDAVALSLAALGVGILTGHLAHLYAKAQVNLIENEREFAHLRGIYEHILNIIPIGVVITNPQNARLLYSNPYVNQIFGSALPRENPGDCFKRPETQKNSSNWICQHEDKYLRVVNFEAEISEGNLAQGYYISNITDLQLAQQEGARRQRLALLGEFSAKVAHEIRNPLACISGCSEMLHMDVQNEEQREILEMMGHEIERLNSLLNDILVFSRKPKLSMDELEIRRVFERQRGVFLHDSANSGIEIVLDIPDEMRLFMDENSICQIIMTLWRNSSEAMDGKGKICVTGDCGRSALLFQDSGPGIKEEEILRIFEPFYTTKKTGTGLGLSIARQLASDNGVELCWDQARNGFVLSKLENDGFDVMSSQENEAVKASSVGQGA